MKILDIFYLMLFLAVSYEIAFVSKKTDSIKPLHLISQVMDVEISNQKFRDYTKVEIFTNHPKHGGKLLSVSNVEEGKFLIDLKTRYQLQRVYIRLVNSSNSIGEYFYVKSMQRLDQKVYQLFNYQSKYITSQLVREEIASVQ